MGVEEENCGDEKNLEAGLDLFAGVTSAFELILSISIVCTGLVARFSWSLLVLLWLLLCEAAEAVVAVSLRRKVAEKDRLLLVKDRLFGWSKEAFECKVKADNDRRRRFSFSFSLPVCGGASFSFIG